MLAASLDDGQEPRISIAVVPVDEAHGLIEQGDYAALLEVPCHRDAPRGCLCLTVSPGVVLLRTPFFAGIAGGTASLWQDARIGRPSYAPRALLAETMAFLAWLRRAPPEPVSGVVGEARQHLAHALRLIAAPSLRHLSA